MKELKQNRNKPSAKFNRFALMAYLILQAISISFSLTSTLSSNLTNWNVSSRVPPQIYGGFIYVPLQGVSNTVQKVNLLTNTLDTSYAINSMITELSISSDGNTLITSSLDSISLTTIRKIFSGGNIKTHDLTIRRDNHILFENTSTLLHSSTGVIQYHAVPTGTPLQFLQNITLSNIDSYYLLTLNDLKNKFSYAGKEGTLVLGTLTSNATSTTFTIKTSTTLALQAPQTSYRYQTQITNSNKFFIFIGGNAYVYKYNSEGGSFSQQSFTSLTPGTIGVTSVNYTAGLVLIGYPNGTVVQFNTYSRLISNTYSLSTNQTLKTINVSPDRSLFIAGFDTHVKVYNVSICSVGFYFNYSCLPCSSSCFTCQNSTSCLTCISGYVWEKINLASGLCQSKCPSNTYLLNSVCYSCDKSCLTCLNSLSCITCAPGYQFLGNALCSILFGSEKGQFSIQFIQAMQYSFSIPMLNTMPVGKIFIIGLSDFWIYNYHNITYGTNVTQVLELIRSIQNLKWAAFKYDKYLSISLNPVQFFLFNYSDYSNPKFFQKEKVSSTFIESILNFLAYTLPLTVLLFVLFRKIFFATFKYRISRHFRRYSIYAAIIPILMEGNIQYFSYICYNQSKILFRLTYQDTFNHCAWIFFFFIIIMTTFIFFYVVYWFYPKTCKLFFDDGFRTFPTLTIFLIITYAKDFVLGAVQSILFEKYQQSIFCIIGIHTFVLLVLVFSQIKYSLFRRSLVLYSIIMESSIKVVLNFLFLVQYILSDQQDLFDLLQNLLMNVLYLWATFLFLRVVAGFLPQKIAQVFNLKESLQSKQNQEQNNNQSLSSKLSIKQNKKETASNQSKKNIKGNFKKDVLSNSKFSKELNKNQIKKITFQQNISQKASNKQINNQQNFKFKKGIKFHKEKTNSSVKSTQNKKKIKDLKSQSNRYRKQIKINDNLIITFLGNRNDQDDMDLIKL